jgi:GTP-binding protein Era
MNSENSENTATRAGYVALIGKPNVGKSTLMNAIMGTKLSIVSDKPQTTRKRVMGIHSTDDLQIVFVDTPGVLEPKYELHRTMMEYVSEAIADADAVVVLVEATDPRRATEFLTEDFQKALKRSGKPTVLVLNKMDALKDRAEALPLLQKFTEMDIFKAVIPISALENKFVDDVLKELEQYIPEHEFYYDPEMLSTLPERFFVSELIREMVFELFKQEIPYSTEVNVVEFKEREAGKWFISAEIIVERTSQKGIIIGAQGSMIKKIGERARKKIEKHLQTPVFLELFVKVREDWRDNPQMLKGFGY